MVQYRRAHATHPLVAIVGQKPVPQLMTLHLAAFGCTCVGQFSGDVGGSTDWEPKHPTSGRPCPTPSRWSGVILPGREVGVIGADHGPRDLSILFKCDLCIEPDPSHHPSWQSPPYRGGNQ